MKILLLLLPTLSLAITDYLIVGSGPAGCALAARLCQALPDQQLVLLERALPFNATEQFLVKAPRLAQDVWNTRLVEPIQTAPNPALLGRPLTLLNGNALGGASAVNALQWNVPPKAQVASWGFDGLTEEKAEELFEEAEQQTGAFQPDSDLRQSLWDEYTQGVTNAGLPELEDPLEDDRSKQGTYYNFVTTTENGMRLDACTAYLAPVRESCTNLQVVQGAEVTKLIIESSEQEKRVSYRCDGEEQCGCNEEPVETDSVKGVEYKMGTEVKTWMARETILSAGPINSPKLLQVSGIGDKDVLTNASVAVKKELPVGLQVESRSFGIITALTAASPPLPDNNPLQYLSQEQRDMFLNGDGGLLGKTVAGVNSRFEEFLIEMSNTFSSNGSLTGLPVFISACLVQPQSNGTILIRSPDGAIPPELNFNYLGGDGELARLRVCMEKVREIHANMPPELGVTEIAPGAGVELSDEVLAQNVLTAHHTVGGCRVGPVVRGDFRVQGIGGIRVVDSSVIPTMPEQAGPMASVYMLAELAAELIEEEAECKLED